MVADARSSPHARRPLISTETPVKEDCGAPREPCARLNTFSLTPPRFDAASNLLAVRAAEAAGSATPSRPDRGQVHDEFPASGVSKVRCARSSESRGLNERQELVGPRPRRLQKRAGRAVRAHLVRFASRATNEPEQAGSNQENRGRFRHRHRGCRRRYGHKRADGQGDVTGRRDKRTLTSCG